MNKYNKHSQCVKCGCSDVHTRYYARQYDYPYHLDGIRSKIPDTDAIVKTCKRCGYKWLEEPLDVESLKEEQDDG